MRKAELISPQVRRVLEWTEKEYEGFWEKMAEDAMDYGIVYADIVDKLLMHPVRVYGDSIQSDFIISIIAKDAEMIKPDVKKEAEESMIEIGG